MPRRRAVAATMAVRADDLALLNLLEDALPAALVERLADLELLVTKVVELEYDRIVLAAVDAWVRAEVLDELTPFAPR